MNNEVSINSKPMSKMDWKNYLKISPTSVLLQKIESCRFTNPYSSPPPPTLPSILKASARFLIQRSLGKVFIKWHTLLLVHEHNKMNLGERTLYVWLFSSLIRLRSERVRV